jgi:hypothetical protein
VLGREFGGHTVVKRLGKKLSIQGHGRVACAGPLCSVWGCLECGLALERLTCSLAVIWAPLVHIIYWDNRH